MKYLKYAIGEIVLIMVGILLALKVQTWSEDKADRELERKFLIRFQSSLNEDLANFKEQVEIGQSGLEALKDAVALMYSENVEDDFYKLNEYYDLAYLESFNPEYSTYQELESTGRLNLIRDEALRLAIQRHYAYYNRMEVGFDHLYTWQKNVSRPFDAETATLKYTGGTKAMFPPKYRSKEDWSILNDPEHPEFKMTERAFAATGWWIDTHLGDYADATARTKELLTKVTAALEALE